VPAPPKPCVDNRLLEGFRGWLHGRVSEDTAEYYAGVVERGEWPPSKGKRIKAWRRYVHYLFSIGGLMWEQYQSYLLFLKTPSSERHRTVEAVQVDTIFKYKEALAREGLGALHVLLLGGARLKHVPRMAATWNLREVVQYPTGRFEQRLYCKEEWCRYYLGVVEGSKRTDYIYFSAAERLKMPAMSYR
jgi:intergrase/recombinase